MTPLVVEEARRCLRAANNSEASAKNKRQFSSWALTLGRCAAIALS